VGAARLVGAATLIAVLTVASRLVGFGRTAVLGWTVQGTALGDVYQAVNTVPNVIFEIVAGGALASLVVPLLAGPAARGDRATVSATASALLTWTLTLLVPLAVLVAAFAGPIVALLAADATAAELDAGERMLRVFAPQLPLYGIGIVLTGVLQAHHRFAWPVLAPLLSSVVVIGTYLTFAAVAGPGADLAEAGRTGEAILAVGTTLGVVALALCLVVPVRRLGLRWRPGYGLADDDRRLARGLAAAGLATVAGQQVAVVVALNRGWAGPAGTVVQYALAQAVYLLPWAVLAVPLATAAYPTLSAAWAERDAGRYAATLAPAARGVLLLSCLGAAALVAVAGPAAEILLDPPGTAPLAAAIAGFAPGLLGYALFALLSRALYARGAAGPAAAATIGGWAVVAVAVVGLAAGLAESDRALALALGNSAGMLVLGVVLVAVVTRLAGRAALAGLGRVAAVGLLAAGLATVAGLAVGRLTAGGPTAGTPGAVTAAVSGMLSGGAVAVVFLGVAYPLDRHDLRPLLAGLRRRLRAATRRPGRD
jgi:putative peptidoglycan lipid II flippase